MVASIRVFALFVLFAALATPAGATVTLYVDFYYGDFDENNDGVWLYSSAIAQSDECAEWIEVVSEIVDPLNSVVASGSSGPQGCISVSANSSGFITVDDAADGDYKGVGDVWMDNVHYGCDVQIRQIIRFAARFVRVGPEPDGRIRFAPYNCAHRCQAPDQCVPGTVTQKYLAARGFYFNPPGGCGGKISATNIEPACFGPAGDPNPAQYSSPC